jgi:inward rectifier potassium channel
VVHPINEESPFYNITIKELVEAQAEMLVFVKAYDESFSSTVVSRTSYTAQEFVYGGKFLLMFNANEEKTKTHLHINKIDLYETVALPETPKVTTTDSVIL